MEEERQPRFRKLSRKRPKLLDEAVCRDKRKDEFNLITNLIKETPTVITEPFNGCPLLRKASCSLPNIESTCFFNSVIQVLRFTPGFLICLHQMAYVNSLWKNGEIPSILKQLHRLFMEMKIQDTSNENSSLSAMIRRILSLFEGDCFHYKFGQQFDAHEFLSWILKIMLGVPEFASVGKKGNGLSWGKRKINQDVTDFRSQFLNGQLKTHLICCECENSKSKTEDFWDLAFKVEENNGTETDEACLSNKSLLDLVCQESSLRDSNKYFCDECLHHVEAKLKIEIENFPQVLIFHPNQIGTASFSTYSKNLNSLPIQETLSCSHSKCVQPCNEHVYQIYAVIVHVGTTMHSGHYISLININPHLFEAHQKLLCLEERVITQPMTRRWKEKLSSNDDTSTKDCCWPNWLKEKLENNSLKEGWTLFNDELIEPCKNVHLKQILLEELGTLATPSVLLYFHC